MKYHRAFVPGGTFFFTVVTYRRRRLLVGDRPIELLRQAFSYVIGNHPFTIDAAVILPDHIHTIWTLSPGDSDFSARWRLLKSHFTHHFVQQDYGALPLSRLNKGEQAVWQRRFWEHTIRDEADYLRHVEYIHYNPVKHGYVLSPKDWPHSSFHQYVRDGLYSADWGAGDELEFGENVGYE